MIVIEKLKVFPSFYYNGIQASYSIYRYEDKDVTGPVYSWYYEWTDSKLEDHESETFETLEELLVEICNRERFELDAMRESLKGWAEIPEYTQGQVLNNILNKIESDLDGDKPENRVDWVN